MSKSVFQSFSYDYYEMLYNSRPDLARQYIESFQKKQKDEKQVKQVNDTIQDIHYKKQWLIDNGYKIYKNYTVQKIEDMYNQAQKDLQNKE